MLLVVQMSLRRRVMNSLVGLIRLMLQYKMSNLGPAKEFLGLKIDRLADGTITLSQSGYISAILV